MPFEFNIKKNKIINGLTFGAVLILLLMRPSLLQGYGYILVPISCFFLIKLVILKNAISLNKYKKIYLLLSFIFALFLLSQNLILGEGVNANIVNNTISIIIPVLLILVIDKNNWLSALKAVVYPVILLSFSYLVTLILFLSGTELSSLQLYNFELDKTIGAYHVIIYFPVSISLGYDFPGIGIRIARAIGYFREPGIFSPIIAFCFFGIDYLKIKYRSFVKVLLIIALIITFSTAGIISFLIAYIYYLYISKNINITYMYKFVVLILSLPLIYIVIFGSYRFSLASKLSQESGQVRMESFSETVNILSNHPLLGVGYLNTEVSGVSFFSTLGQIGIVGGILFLSIFIVTFINKIISKDQILALFIPVFVVAILSQPLFDKTLLFLMATLTLSAPKIYNTSIK